MSSLDVFTRFFDGEEVLQSEIEERLSSDNFRRVILLLNVASVCGLAYKSYSVDGQKRSLSSMGKALYDVIASEFEAESEE